MAEFTPVEWQVGTTRGRILLIERSDALRWAHRAFLVVALLGTWIAMAELDRVLSSIPDASGQTATTNQLTGPAALLNQRLWDAWFSTGRPAEGQNALLFVASAHAVVDIAFILTYFVLFRRLLAPLMSTAQHDRLDWARKSLPWLLRGTAAIDVAESGLLIATAAFGAPTGLRYALALFATAKWVALAGFLALVLLVPETRSGLRVRLRRLGWALKIHRLALFFLVLFGGLALVPSGQAVFDQIPDVQRRWFPGTESGATGWDWWTLELARWREPVVATALLAVLAAAFWMLGRRRSARNLSLLNESPTTPPSDGEPPIYQWWIVTPMLVVGGALAVIVADGDPRIMAAVAIAASGVTAVVAWRAQKAIDHHQELVWWQLSRPEAVALALSLLVAASGAVALFATATVPSVNLRVAGGLLLVSGLAVSLSLVIEHFRRASPPPPDSPAATLIASAGLLTARERKARGVATTRIGDLVAVFVLCLSPLSLIRSALGPTAAALFYNGEQRDLLSTAGCWLIVAVVAAAGLPWATALLIHWLDTHLGEADTAGLGRAVFDPTATTPLSDTRVLVLEAALFGFGALTVGFGVLLPDWFARSLGPIGVTLALLGGWSMILGAVTLALQRRRPLAVFSALGLRSTPNIALTALLMLVTSTVFNTADLHAVRTLDAEQPPTTTETPQQWAHGVLAPWLDAEPPRCPGEAEQSEVGQDRVRPLLLVVAEGGGARAAYWTAKALELLNDPASPLCNSVVLASGVSGGSVGLVANQLTWSGGANPGPETAVDAVVAMTGPDPLARAFTGLLGGDLLAGLSGVRVPTSIEPPDQWEDRAGHLEQGWADATGGSGSPLNSRMRTQPPAGRPFLVLNSVDAVTGCRVLVAQEPANSILAWEIPATAGKPEETLTTSECASLDNATAGAVSLQQLNPTCMTSLRASTAALLSARFPIVTPAGRLIGPCASRDVQLVDGGYSDGSGLATMAELAPAIVSEIADHNAAVTQCRQSAKDEKASPANCGAYAQPVVVYLKNSPGAGLTEPDPAPAAELLVPLRGLYGRDLQTSEATWLQRLDGIIAGACAGGPDDAQCSKSLQSWTSVRTVMIAPRAKPAPAPPLGWTLSQMSLRAMDAALNDEKTCPPTTTAPATARKAARLCELLLVARQP